MFPDNAVISDFQDLSLDFAKFTALHKDYTQKLSEIGELQGKCTKELNHQRYQLSKIRKTINRLKKKEKNDETLKELRELEKKVEERTIELFVMEEALPKKSRLYLRIVLGNVNVSILNKDEKFKYKDEYEKFKLIVYGGAMLMSVANICVDSRVLDLLFKFLLVWYYCTLTIRESILKVNGSTMKGWWRIHHFVFTALSGVLLIWPHDQLYYSFKNQFMIFSIYISFLQFLQFKYQRGCLYRLRALGEKTNMDITIEGFHSYMFRGLSFILPFLIIGYIYELYNAYVLYHLSFHPEASWQIPVLSALFFVVFLGNMFTALMVVPQKLREKVKLRGRFGLVQLLRRKMSMVNMNAMLHNGGRGQNKNE